MQDGERESSWAKKVSPLLCYYKERKRCLIQMYEISKIAPKVTFRQRKNTVVALSLPENLDTRDNVKLMFFLHAILCFDSDRYIGVRMPRGCSVTVEHPRNSLGIIVRVDSSTISSPFRSRARTKPQPRTLTKIFWRFDGASTTGPARSRGCSGDFTPYSLWSRYSDASARRRSITLPPDDADVESVVALTRDRREATRTGRDVKRRVIITVVRVVPYIVPSRIRKRDTCVEEMTTTAATWERE